MRRVRAAKARGEGTARRVRSRTFYLYVREARDGFAERAGFVSRGVGIWFRGGPGGGAAHLAVRPPGDAVLATSLLQDGDAQTELRSRGGGRGETRVRLPSRRPRAGGSRNRTAAVGRLSSARRVAGEKRAVGGAYLVRDVVDGQVEVGAQHLEGEALRLASAAFLRSGARGASASRASSRARGGGEGASRARRKVFANDGSHVARFSFLRLGMAKKGARVASVVARVRRRRAFARAFDREDASATRARRGPDRRARSSPPRSRVPRRSPWACSRPAFVFSTAKRRGAADSFPPVIPSPVALARAFASDAARIPERTGAPGRPLERRVSSRRSAAPRASRGTVTCARGLRFSLVASAEGADADRAARAREHCAFSQPLPTALLV